MTDTYTLAVVTTPKQLRLTKSKAEVRTKISNHGDTSITLSWQFVSLNDGRDDVSRWMVAPEGRWPMTVSLESRSSRIWTVAIEVPDDAKPGTFSLEPYVAFDRTVSTAGLPTVETNRVVLELVDSEPGGNRGWVRRHWIAITIACVAVIAIAVGLWVTVGRWTTVPDVKGYSQDQASQIARDADLIVVSLPTADEKGGQGLVVVDQVPEAFARVLRGETLTLFVGPISSVDSVLVPNVIGLTAQDAKMRLEASGFHVEFRYENSAERYDSVFGSFPSEGTQANANSVVTLRVASVDDWQLMGRSLPEVRSALERRGVSVRAYYFDLGWIVDETKGICRSASSMLDSSCVVAAIGKNPELRQFTLGVIAAG